jgi:hypothetical protein
LLKKHNTQISLGKAEALTSIKSFKSLGLEACVNLLHRNGKVLLTIGQPLLSATPSKFVSCDGELSKQSNALFCEGDRFIASLLNSCVINICQRMWRGVGILRNVGMCLENFASDVLFDDPGRDLWREGSFSSMLATEVNTLLQNGKYNA